MFAHELIRVRVCGVHPLSQLGIVFLRRHVHREDGVQLLLIQNDVSKVGSRFQAGHTFSHGAVVACLTFLWTRGLATADKAATIQVEMIDRNIHHKHHALLSFPLTGKSPNLGCIVGADEEAVVTDNLGRDQSRHPCSFFGAE